LFSYEGKVAQKNYIRLFCLLFWEVAMLKFENEKKEAESVIKVIGVGGAGGNIINRMIESNLKKVEFIAINTDVKELYKSNASEKIIIGESLVRGLGTGCNPQIGYHSAYENLDKIKAIVEGADIVFITAGLGGGTGTGASPVIAESARKAGALTVVVVAEPFDFEGTVRRFQAEIGLKELKNYADALIVIPNQKLIDTIDKNTSITEAFDMSSDIIRHAVQSITDLITESGYIVVDINDVKAVMCDAGKVFMGIGTGSGENRATKAVEKAMSNPLLEEMTIYNAKSLLVNISGSQDMGLQEVSDAMSLIHSSIGPEANAIWGMVIDESLGDEVKFTFFATGLDANELDSLLEE
jgi:cell division protein FtsZ